MTTKKSAIDLLSEAYQVQKKDVDIPLLNGEVLEAQLTAPDIWAIQKEQKIVYENELDEFKALEWDKKPINEGEWNSELAQYSDEAKKNLVKPANRAEQAASDSAKSATIKQIIPKYLSYRDTGEPLFVDAKSREAFVRILASSPKLFIQLANAFVELSSQMTEDQENVKN